LALVACERFGATLAICLETCRKIEDLIRKTRGPTAIRFLSALVGYTPTDCASHLIRSEAGVQFLGLAAALVTTMGPSQGGNALAAMLKNSAVDKTLLPTATQLKELLASMEHRCVACGFSDLVLGYQILLSKPPALSAQQAFDLWQGSASYPDPSGLEKLVDAFRQLSRVGDADVHSIVIKTTACSPWVIAFTRWCLNLPPSIYFEDGTVLLEQSASRVTVITNKDVGKLGGIEIHGS
jgi:hypothetical protein